MWQILIEYYVVISNWFIVHMCKAVIVPEFLVVSLVVYYVYYTHCEIVLYQSNGNYMLLNYCQLIEPPHDNGCLSYAQV